MGDPPTVGALVESAVALPWAAMHEADLDRLEDIKAKISPCLAHRERRHSPEAVTSTRRPCA